MAKMKKTKPTNKDLVFNISSNKILILEVSQKVQWLEAVINKYIEMNKDSKKFNKYLQDAIGKREDEETKDTN